MTNYYTTCMAGKICPFPLYDQVVYLKIRARNDMKILALMEFSEYTLKVLLPRKVLSAEKRFSDVSLDLIYITCFGCTHLLGSYEIEITAESECTV